MATRVACIILSLHIVSGSEHFYRNEGFMNHLNTGMKLAQNLLGSESVALKVADFVVRAFQTTSPTRGPVAAGQRRPAQGSYGEPLPSEEHSFEETLPEPSPQGAPPATPWRYLVRLLGLQPNQLSAVAVNALVFVAQIITSFLAGPKRYSKSAYRSDDLTDWILNKNSKKLQIIIAAAKNESLTDLVEELVAEYSTQEETSCIRLLVCKITPFVTRMQESVFGKENVNSFNKETRGADVLYRHLPSNEEIRDRSDICQKRYPNCRLNE